MILLRAKSSLLCIALSAVAMAAWSQQLAQSPGAAAHAKPVNLQVLPKDMPATSLGRLMKDYERDLGVSCSYCHVENRDTGKLDHVSDENPMKQTARTMIAMLDDINNRHLAQLGGDRRYAVPVTCGSCHQGRSNPLPFEAGRR